MTTVHQRWLLLIRGTLNVQNEGGNKASKVPNREAVSILGGFNGVLYYTSFVSRVLDHKNTPWLSWKYWSHTLQNSGMKISPLYFVFIFELSVLNYDFDQITVVCSHMNKSSWGTCKGCSIVYAELFVYYSSPHGQAVKCQWICLCYGSSLAQIVWVKPSFSTCEWSAGWPYVLWFAHLLD